MSNIWSKIHTASYSFILFLILLPLCLFSNEFIKIEGENDNSNEKSVMAPELAVVAIFRDEARFLKEWIEYYRIQGVSKFYLFNNLSIDNYKKVLKPYIRAGIVNLYKWDVDAADVGYWNFIQVQCYAYGMEQARKDGVTWLIVIDTDEFIVPITYETLLDVVHQFDDTDVGMLSAFWIMFGTSGVHKVAKKELMIETLLFNGGYSSACGEKSILHTKRADTDGPHFGRCLPGFNHIRLPLEFMQIFHYWSRDEKFFNEVKIPRREIWGWSASQTINFMNSFNNPDFVDVAQPILRYGHTLKSNMGFKEVDLGSGLTWGETNQPIYKRKPFGFCPLIL